MRLRNFALALLPVGMLTLSAGTATAVPVKLSDLIANNGFVIDEDKRFDNFSCSVVGNGLTAGGCGSVNVDTLVNDTGLRFQDFFAAFNAGSSLDVLIGYDVTVLDPNRQIESITLAFNGAVTGGSFTNVTETAFDANGTPVGQAAVFNPPLLLSTEVLLDSPQSTLHIVKDIGLASTQTPGQATISFVDQDFHQTSVPEPATLALFGAGLVGLGLVRSRRRA